MVALQMEVKHVFISSHKNAGQNHNLMIADKPLKMW